MHPYRLELAYVQLSGHLGAMDIPLIAVLKLHFVFLLKRFNYVQKTRYDTCHYSSTISSKAKD